MNIKLFPLIFVFGFFGILNSFAQGTGIKTEYLKDEDLTKVESNMLYVGNAADQFVEIQLTGSYKGVEAAPQIKISVYSFSKEPIFKKDKDRTLVIIANGTET